MYCLSPTQQRKVVAIAAIIAIAGLMSGNGSADADENVLESTSGYRAVNEDSSASGLPDPIPRVHIITPEGNVLARPDDDYLAGELHWLEWIGHESWPYDALVQWTGGMGCCFWYTFVSKSPPYRALPRFDGGTASPELVDPDGDGIMEFIVREDAYSFGTDSVHRTMPSVLWRVTDEGPELAKELMASWRFSDSDLDVIRDQLSEKAIFNYFNGWTLQLTSTVITQYYATDDLDETRAAFDRIWTQKKTDKEGWWSGKEEWWARIIYQIRCSAYGIPGVECR